MDFEIHDQIVAWCLGIGDHIVKDGEPYIVMEIHDDEKGVITVTARDQWGEIEDISYADNDIVPLIDGVDI